MAQGLPLPACLKPPSLAKLAIIRGLLAVACAEVAVAAAELTVMAPVKKKMTNDEMVGLIREAMALRVKFRLKDENQKDRAKKILLLTMLCVNRHNRGGNYPNPTTVLNLLIKIFNDGFNPSDANHEGVCVQAIPSKERPVDSITELEYNINKCKHTLLEGCFEDDAEAAYSTLSHSHLLLTLLCWLKGLKVQVPLDAKGVPAGKWPKVLDQTGHLNPAAVADLDDGYNVLTSGLKFEILSWKYS